MITYVNTLLDAWGRWSARGNDGGIGWPTTSAMFKDMPVGVGTYGSKPPLGIGSGNADCVVTDKAVQRLKDQDVRLFDLCREFYKVRGTGKAVAERLGISKRTMYDRLDVLHQKVLGNLNDIEAGC